MADAHSVQVEDVDDTGEQITVRVANTRLILATEEVDLLARELLVACQAAQSRQREHGLAPGINADGATRTVALCRTGAGRTGVLLQLLLQNTSKDQSEIAAFLMPPDLADDLSAGLARNADAVRQLRRPS